VVGARALAGVPLHARADDERHHAAGELADLVAVPVEHEKQRAARIECGVHRRVEARLHGRDGGSPTPS
jgi:hypothetical protein